LNNIMMISNLLEPTELRLAKKRKAKVQLVASQSTTKRTKIENKSSKLTSSVKENKSEVQTLPDPKELIAKRLAVSSKSTLLSLNELILQLQKINS